MTDAVVRTIKDLVTDFLSSAPSLEEIAAYRLPAELQERAQELLAKNSSNMLASDEQHEIAEYRQIDHLLTLVKAKARLKLKSQK